MVPNFVTSLLRMYEKFKKKLSSKQRVKLHNCNWQMLECCCYARSEYAVCTTGPELLRWKKATITYCVNPVPSEHISLSGHCYL